jgi:hypothetical protein
MKRLVSLLLVIVMIVCMSACSSTPKEAPIDAGAPIETESTDAGATDSPDTAAPSGNNSATLEQFITEGQPAIDAMNEAMKDVMQITLSAEGETLVYTYKFTNDVGDLSTVKQSLEGEMENQRSTMETVVKSLKDAGIANPGVVMKYLNNDGSEITSFEFK